MATATPTILLFVFLAAFAASGGYSISTPYEALQDFNFPPGLLPKGAVGYDLDEKTGKFNAYFEGSCSYAVEGSYQLSFKPQISGYLSTNKLTNLSGVSVKVFFFWLNIVEVTRSGDQMELSVGIGSANFPIDNFYESPQCGCGFDCDGIRTSNCLDARRMKIKIKADSGVFSSI